MLTPRWSTGHLGVSASQPLPGCHALPAALSHFCLLSLLSPSSYSCSPRVPGASASEKLCGGPAAPSRVADSREDHGGGPATPRGGEGLKLPGFPQPYTLPWKPPSNHANRPCPRVCSSAVWLSPGPSGVTLRAQGQAEAGEP